jgi:RNA polymerase sigma-70 factor (family 1)
MAIDESAFEQVFRAYSDRLCAFAAQYLGSSEAAEEVVEDVFLNIWRARNTWLVTGSLKSYLYTATRNQALNVLKRQGVERRHLDMVAANPDKPHSAPADADLVAEDFRRAAERVIAALPDRCREVFLLHRQHDLSYAEIAAAMDITVKTVENQLGRALKLLREKLQDYL